MARAEAGSHLDRLTSPERNNLLFIDINYSSCCSAAVLMDLEILSFSLWKVNVDRAHADLQILSLETSDFALHVCVVSQQTTIVIFSADQ